MRAELCGPYPPHFRTFKRFHSSSAKTFGLWSNRKLVLLPCAFANDADSRSNEACFGKSFLLPAFSPGEFQSASLFARAWAINPSESSNLFARRPDGWQSRPRRQRILSPLDCEWLNRNLGNRGKVSQKADQDPRNVVSGNGLLFVCCICFPGLALQFDAISRSSVRAISHKLPRQPFGARPRFFEFEGSFAGCSRTHDAKHHSRCVDGGKGGVFARANRAGGAAPSRDPPSR